jgi:hypothetical protein
MATAFDVLVSLRGFIENDTHKQSDDVASGGPFWKMPEAGTLTQECESPASLTNHRAAAFNFNFSRRWNSAASAAFAALFIGSHRSDGGAASSQSRHHHAAATA